MTTTTAPETTSAKPSFLRRHRFTVLIVLALAIALFIAIKTSGTQRNNQPLDPDNPGPDGAQAVARVLDNEGVNVDVVRSAEELESTDVDGKTAIVVTQSSLLGPSTYDRLIQHAGGRPVIIIDALFAATQSDGNGYPESVDTGDAIEADCDLDLFDGLELKVDDALAYPGAGCFEVDSKFVYSQSDSVIAFGAGDALTNDQVLRGDNAAIALRLLGQHDHLIWYVANSEDLSGDEANDTLRELVPDWIEPGFWLICLASLFLIGWRFRRLGPLATEPLPVVVKAIETTQSRGRLYRKAGDRAHAAQAMRASARKRVAARLRLGMGQDEAALIRETARHLGRTEAEVASVIASSAQPPNSDQDLITLANDLAALEEEVRRS